MTIFLQKIIVIFQLALNVTKLNESNPSNNTAQQVSHTIMWKKGIAVFIITLNL